MIHKDKALFLPLHSEGKDEEGHNRCSQDWTMATTQDAVSGILLVMDVDGVTRAGVTDTAHPDVVAGVRRVLNIAKDKITSIAYINEKIQQEYNRVFSKIEVPNKPKIIT